MQPSIDEIMAPLIGQHISEVEYRLFCCDHSVRISKFDNDDFGPPSGFDTNRVNLILTRQFKVVSYYVG